MGSLPILCLETQPPRQGSCLPPGSPLLPRALLSFQPPKGPGPAIPEALRRDAGLGHNTARSTWHHPPLQAVPRCCPRLLPPVNGVVGLSWPPAELWWKHSGSARRPKQLKNEGSLLAEMRRRCSEQARKGGSKGEAPLFSSLLSKNAHFPKKAALHHRHFPPKPCLTAWTLWIFLFKGESPEGEADAGLPAAVGCNTEPPPGCSGWLGRVPIPRVPQLPALSSSCGKSLSIFKRSGGQLMPSLVAKGWLLPRSSSAA